MTRLPHENRDVVGLSQADGPQYIKYKVGPICAVPGCSRLADHSHHIWRRSFVIGDKPWVRLWDGTITGNLTGLCFHHHNLITENRVGIVWEHGNYWWAEDNLKVMIDQPPILYPGATGYAIVNLSDQVSPPKLEPEKHEHGPGAVEKCPTCRRSLPRESAKKEGPRHREKWTITVPVDERENGADVLDTLLEECAKIFGHDETKAVKYFTLVQALALVVQNGEKMMSDG